MSMWTLRPAVVIALLAIVATSAPAVANSKLCNVRDGVVAEVTPGPLLPAFDTITLKGSYKAEFRWDLWDKEAVGWMRIIDADGKEIGWVPAGHEGVQCGEGN